MDAVTSRLPLGASLSVMPTSELPSASRSSLLALVNMTVGRDPSAMVMLRVAVVPPASGTMLHPVGRVAAANSRLRVSSLAISERDVTVSTGADVPLGSVHVLPARIPPETERL